MIIAQRMLTLKSAGGDIDIPIQIHAPEKADDHWICRFEINWPGERLERHGAGIDAVQALLIAMQMIGAHIYSSEEHESGGLSWLESGRGYGFPVAKTIRDSLVGDDKTFF
jgi:hypothetical protein